MGTFKSNRWTDDQLEAIFSETGDWSVNGSQGQVLCHAASLRRALERASEFAAAGAVVTAICRIPMNSVIVPNEQIARLRKTIAVRELLPDGGHSDRAV